MGIRKNEVGGNTPNVSKLPARVGGNTPNVPKPKPSAQISGNTFPGFVEGGRKVRSMK